MCLSLSGNHVENNDEKRFAYVSKFAISFDKNETDEYSARSLSQIDRMY